MQQVLYISSVGFHFMEELKKMFGSVDWRGILLCILVLALLSPFIAYDLLQVKKGSRNYREEDVESALTFISLLEDNDIVVPQKWTQDLLIYAGIDLGKMIHDGDLLQELYSDNTLKDFCQKILTEHLTTSRAQVFLIKRWIGNKNIPAPSKSFLEVMGEKHEIGSIVFYTISLSSDVAEWELLETPVAAQLPVGPQWVYINITGTNLLNGTILGFRIVNNNNAPKKFFAKISDIHGNSTERIIFTLQLGTQYYYIQLTQIEEIIELNSPASFTLCFSWYNWEPNIDLTITNLILIALN